MVCACVDELACVYRGKNVHTCEIQKKHIFTPRYIHVNLSPEPFPELFEVTGSVYTHETDGSDFTFSVAAANHRALGRINCVGQHHGRHDQR